MSTSPEAARLRLNQMVVAARDSMRDYAELNRLISGVETSDRMFKTAILDTIEDWNVSPPWLTPFTIENPPPWSILRFGVIAYVLDSLVVLQNRNNISFNNGGISVQISPERMNAQLAEGYRARYERKRDEYKAAQNIAAALGPSATATEYSFINDGFLHGVY
ncbi:hypothetical protein EBT31_07635 [bacterium]|nr:hypothetical protein [bacterium]